MSDIENLNNIPFESWLEDCQKYWANHIIDRGFSTDYKEFNPISNDKLLEKFSWKYNFKKKYIHESYKNIIKEYFFNFQDVKTYHLGHLEEPYYISDVYIGYNSSSMFIYEDCLIMDG